MLRRVQKLLVTGLFSAMLPQYWLTEGGQSATGALLDHIVENHVAAAHLANRAASQRTDISCAFDMYLYSLIVLKTLG